MSKERPICSVVLPNVLLTILVAGCAPIVVSTNPMNGATNVEPDSTITATFSKTMNGATLTTSSITLTGPGGAIAGNVSYSELSATFSPASALDTNTSYTATVTTAAQDLDGYSLANNYIWNFTTWPFTSQLGTSMEDYGDSIAIDVSGNVYISGVTSGILDGQTSAGFGDFFVAKYQSTGAKQWTRQFGTTGWDFGRFVATDASGNVYVAGETKGALEGQTSAGDWDLFIVKYDNKGVRQWARQLGTAGRDAGSGVATDASGNIYVSGSTNGALDDQTSTGLSDLLVVKYDSAGVKQWVRQLGTAERDYGIGVATDTSGNIYVSGITKGALDGQTLAGDWDIFIVKYDGSGNKQWARQLGTAEMDSGGSVATDASGNIYVAGETRGAFEGQNLVGNLDIFVAKYDGAGVKQWIRQLGSVQDDSGSGVATDASGNVYVTGSTMGALDGQTSAGLRDLFVLKYDSNGNKQWIRQFGTAKMDSGRGVATDAGGNVYVTGETCGAIVGLISDKNGDSFIVKYDSNGNKK